MAITESRNLARENLFLLADLRVEGESGQHRIKVRNLSAGGMMGDGRVPVKRGGRISVDLRNAGQVSGTVAWVQDGRFGVAFDSEVDLALVRQAEGAADGTEG